MGDDWPGGGESGLRGNPVVRGPQAGRSKTTVSHKNEPCPPDRVKRSRQAVCRRTSERCAALWVADLTDASTGQSFVYVAFAIDVFSRRTVGWKVPVPPTPKTLNSLL